MQAPMRGIKKNVIPGLIRDLINGNRKRPVIRRLPRHSLSLSRSLLLAMTVSREFFTLAQTTVFQYLKAPNQPYAKIYF